MERKGSMLAQKLKVMEIAETTVDCRLTGMKQVWLKMQIKFAESPTTLLLLQ